MFLQHSFSLHWYVTETTITDIDIFMTNKTATIIENIVLFDVSAYA